MMKDDIPNFDEDDCPQKPNEQQKQFDNYNVSQFKDFGLREELLRAVKEAGFEHPTRVQTESLTNALQGEQLICQAKAGTGKTAVFVLTVLNSINTSSDKVECLVITHTRELAQQARDEFNRLGKFLKNIKVECFYGGGEPVSGNCQTLEIVKPHIVVGQHSGPTQGPHLRPQEAQRQQDPLLHPRRGRHHDRGPEHEVPISSDIIARKDIQEIFYKTPQDKQFMAFSATFSEQSRSALKRFISETKHIYEITIKPEQLFLDKLKQYYMKVPECNKFHYLLQIIRTCKLNQCIIFVRNSNKADVLVDELKKRDEQSVRQLYGGNRQDTEYQRIRQKTYDQFRSGHFRLLVATNLMGRGIDIDKVNYVINFDMPDSLETYLHRVGRAGRQETNGVAISFVRTDEDNKDPSKRHSDEDVLAQILKQYPEKLQPLPQDLSTLDKF